MKNSDGEFLPSFSNLELRTSSHLHRGWLSTLGGRWHRRAVGVIVTALLVFTSAYSQPSRNSDLDRIRGEIAKLKSRLDDVHRQAQSAQQELEAVDLELGIRTRELTLAVDMQS